MVIAAGNGSTPPHALVVLAAAGPSDSRWLAHAPRPFVVVNKTKEGIPNTGLDASSYAWWIIRNYGNLPTWTLFMHHHEYHWHHPYYSQLLSMAIDIDELDARYGLRYLNVAHDRFGKMLLYTKPALRELTTKENQRLCTELLGAGASAFAYSGNVTYAPGAQFWVHKERILAHSRSFYERLYRALTDDRHPLLGRSSMFYEARALHVFFAEAYWHAILGEGSHLRPPIATYRSLPFLSAVAWPSLQRRYSCDTPYKWALRQSCGPSTDGQLHVGSPRQRSGGNATREREIVQAARRRPNQQGQRLAKSSRTSLP